MKKLYLLILRSYAGPGIATFFIAVFVLLMQFLWRYVDDLVGKGLEWNIISQLMFYASFTFVPLALPLSILLSSLMTFGNLGERYELVAIKAAGISLRKVMMPLAVFSLLLSVGAFYYANHVLPYANLKFRTILYDVRQKKSALNIREGVFYSGLDGYSIRIGKKDPDGVKIRKIMIYDHSKGMGNSNLTIADSGLMEQTPDKNFMLITLFNGWNYDENKSRSSYNKKPFQRTQFGKQVVKFDLSQFDLTRTNEEFFRSAQFMLNIRQLDKVADSLQQEINNRSQEMKRSILSYYRFYGDALLTDSILVSASPMPDTALVFADTAADHSRRIIAEALGIARNVKSSFEFNRQVIRERMTLRAKYLNEWHRKFTLSIACLALFLIGAPLGSIIRKGGLGMPLVVSVLLFVAYHVISFTGEKASRSSIVDSWEGMWFSTLIFLPVGIFLTYKAATDSRLFDAESQHQWFGKLILRISKKNNRKDEDTSAV